MGIDPDASRLGVRQSTSWAVTSCARGVVSSAASEKEAASSGRNARKELTTASRSRIV